MNTYKVFMGRNQETKQFWICFFNALQASIQQKLNKVEKTFCNRLILIQIVSAGPDGPSYCASLEYATKQLFSKAVIFSKKKRTKKHAYCVA